MASADVKHHVYSSSSSFTGRVFSGWHLRCVPDGQPCRSHLPHLHLPDGGGGRQLVLRSVVFCAIRLLAKYTLPSAVPQYTLTVGLCAIRLLAEYPLPTAVPQYTLTVALC